MAPYSGQNAGAGKLERLGQGVRAASICGFIYSGVALVLVLLFGRELCLLFLDSTETEVIGYAHRFLVSASCGFCLLTLVNVVRFTIQGMGFSGFAMTAGVLEMVARGIAGLVLVPLIGFWGICLAHPMAWIFADSFLIPAFFSCKKKLANRKECETF